MGLGAVVGALLVTIVSGAIEYFVGVRFPSGLLASALLLLGGVILCARKPLRPVVLSLFGLVSAFAVGGCVALAKGAELSDAASSIAGFLLVPAVLVIGYAVFPRNPKVAMRWLVGFALVQVPLLCANELGMLTPIPRNDVFTAQDRYQGTFLMHGPYFSTYVVATALAVVAARARRTSVSSLSIGAIVALAYWTENRIIFLLVAVGVGSVLGWTLYSRNRTARSASWALLLLAGMTLGGAAAATAVPARTWGQWGVDNWNTVVSSGESQTSPKTRSASSVSAPEAISDKSESVREVLNWRGRVWQGNAWTALTGRGASLGLSHGAERITTAEPLPSIPSRLHFANPSMSLVIGPASSFLGLLSEFGLVGLGFFVLTVGLIFRELWRRLRRRELLALLPPYVVLWLLTPVLESPVLPAVLGLALLAVTPVQAPAEPRLPDDAAGSQSPSALEHGLARAPIQKGGSQRPLA